MERCCTVFRKTLAAILVFTVTVITMTVFFSCNAYAGIAGDEAFSGLVWTKKATLNKQSTKAIVQSVCVTEDYIITLENTADDPAAIDIATAYYRNKTDANGNPVEQYSIARQVADREWEHCNGMTYNPNTGLIYVALYTSLLGTNAGNLYVMDPNSLQKVDEIHIADDCNILGISYVEEEDRYYMLTNKDANFQVRIFDSGFNQLGSAGNIDPAPASNMQDILVTEDYLLTFSTSPTRFFVYSISRGTLLYTDTLTFDSDYTSAACEPESMTKTGDGTYLAVIDGHDSYAYLYEIKVPYTYTINASAQNGTVTQETFTALRGTSTSVDYAPADGYLIDTITVDGVGIDVQTAPTRFVFDDVEGDHIIDVTYKEIPIVTYDAEEAGEAASGAEAAETTPALGKVGQAFAAAGSFFATLFRRVGSVLIPVLLIIAIVIMLVLIASRVRTLAHLNKEAGINPVRELAVSLRDFLIGIATGFASLVASPFIKPRRKRENAERRTRRLEELDRDREYEAEQNIVYDMSADEIMALIEEEHLATPSYKLKAEKAEARKAKAEQEAKKAAAKKRKAKDTSGRKPAPEAEPVLVKMPVLNFDTNLNVEAASASYEAPAFAQTEPVKQKRRKKTAAPAEDYRMSQEEIMALLENEHYDDSYTKVEETPKTPADSGKKRKKRKEQPRHTERVASEKVETRKKRREHKAPETFDHAGSSTFTQEGSDRMTLDEINDLLNNEH